MKREIKFRAWDGEKMVEVAELHLNTKELLVDDEELLSMCYSPLMQFTGLHDKNGREIYEGDVLDCINGDINTSDKAFYPGRYMGQVGFVGASFIVWPRPVVDGHRMHYGCEVLSDGLAKYTWENEIAAGESVVVGNVYANPELLEAEK